MLFFHFQAILDPSIVEICYATFHHVNKDGFIVHGCVKNGLCSSFSVHVTEEIRAFVLENFKLGLSIYQVMSKHKCKVKETMENNSELSKDLFLSEQDICNLARKLTKHIYKKHENDA